MDLYIVTNLVKVLEKMRELGLRYRENDNSDVVIGIFFDVDCPACARMHRECGEYLISLAREGKVDLFYLDFPVHKGSERAHVLVRRIFQRNPELFIETLRKIYSQDGKDFVEKAKNLDVPQSEIDQVMSCKKFGKELGVRGTPTLLIGIKSKNIAIVMEGYWGRQAVEKLIEKALSKDRDLEKLITLLVLIGNIREYPPSEAGRAETKIGTESGNVSAQTSSPQTSL